MRDYCSPIPDEENVHNMFLEETITPVQSNEVESAVPNTTTDPFGDFSTGPNTFDDDGIKQITNPIFQLDSDPSAATTTPDVSMHTPGDANGTVYNVSINSPANGTNFDAQRTSTPSRPAELLDETTPVSDGDSSLSFMSAASVPLSKNDQEDDDDTSSFNTMMTSQSEDPSFYSFTSSSTTPSLQTSTDGSYKTITDSSLMSEGAVDQSDEDDEKTFVDHASELEDSVISDFDGTPGKGFVSLSGKSLFVSLTFFRDLFLIINLNLYCDVKEQ